MRLRQINAVLPAESCSDDFLYCAIPDLAFADAVSQDAGMRSVHENHALREALHSIYVAQFRAWKACPAGFTKADATRMITGLMGSRPWSWRVVGITPAALELLASNDFKRPPRQLQRGHRVDRSMTAHCLFDREEPLPLKEFFDFYLERDQTVIMTNAENAHRPGSQFPHFFPIDADAELFPCGTLVGWRHRKKETEFLREFYEKTMRKGQPHE